MKKLFTVTLFLVQMLSWAGEPVYDFKIAKEKALKEGKIILLKFCGSDWCIPCIKIQKNVMEDPRFKSFSDENLVVLEADFPRLKKNKISAEQQKKNKDLAEQFNKEGIFPKLVLMNADGKVLNFWNGLGSHPEPADLISKIQKTLQNKH